MKQLHLNLIGICLILINIGNIQAQDWDRRHDFAKSYFGVGTYVVPNMVSGSFLNSSNQIQSFYRSGFISPAVNIGATHFWGHADFYVSINTTDIKWRSDALDNSTRLGTFTGLRVYPLASRPNTIRPYLGYKFSPFRYRQSDINGEAFKFTQVKSVVDFGIGYQGPNFYMTLEYGKVFKTDFDLYLSRQTLVKDKYPRHLIQIGLNVMVETTKSASSSYNRQANELFAKTNQWGLFIAAGPSSSFPVGSSSFVTESYPFLDDQSFPIIFPDLALGYHFTKTDIVSALSFRPMTQGRSAFGFDQSIRRQSINLESYKFIGDYHGFVPYLGLGLSYEDIEVTSEEMGTALPMNSQHLFSPNIVFGWDIRPSVKGDWWVLRTNLRYFPFLQIDHQNKKLSLQHVEFNFIQFVFYPQRLKQVRSLIK